MNLDATIPIEANGKRPLVPWRAYQTRLPTEEERATWRRQWPDANQALVTGAISELVVVDVDPRRNGGQALQGRALPPTRVVRTPSGGAHYYFQHPGQTVPCVPDLLPGVDLKGDGGYVLVPPSSIDGNAYEVVIDEPPAPMPQWLPAVLQLRAVRGGTGRLDATELASLLRGVPEGQRDASAARIAGHYLAKGIPAGETLELLKLWNANNRPPLDEATLRKVLRSINGRETRKRTQTGNGQGAIGEDRPARTLTVLTAKALCALPDPDPQAELLGAVLVRGARTLIGAHTGHGKTTLAFAMIKAVVTKSAFLDWTGAGGRALVIDAEQGLRTIKRRLREAGLDDSEAVHYVQVPDGLALDKDQAEADAIETILQTGRYDLVLLDPLYKLHTGDSNSEREAVDLMRRLDRWRETYRFALVLVTHTRKPPPLGARFTMHEFFGSGAYLRGAEVILGLQMIKAGFSKLHFFKDRDGDLPVGTSRGLLFDRAAGFTRAPASTREIIENLLIGHPGALTTDDLIEKTGKTRTTVDKHLRALRAVGTTEEHGRKRWSLPDDHEADDPEDLA